MRWFTQRVRAPALLLGLALAAWPSLSAGKQAQPELRVGICDSLLAGIPAPLAPAMTQPLASLIESQTGFVGHCESGGDALELSAKVADGRMHLGIFTGVEFAWAKARRPELRALMLVINRDDHLQALTIVSKDSPASNFADLRQATAVMARRSRLHCLLYLDRRCRGCGCEPSGFFSRLQHLADTEDAIDDVVDGRATTAVVDKTCFESYLRRKPARAARVRVLDRSEVFPAGAVAYRPGVLDDETLRRLREGMIGARRTAFGRQLLTLWKMTAFEAVPHHYADMIGDILLHYPPPQPRAEPVWSAWLR